MSPSLFSSLHLTCGSGCDQVLKAEIGREYPEFRFSYSRPGFQTWILPVDRPLVVGRTSLFPNFRAIFAQSAMLGIGRIQVNTADQTAPASSSSVHQFWDICQSAIASPLFTTLAGTDLHKQGSHRLTRLHVWERPQRGGEESGLTPQAEQLHHQLMSAIPVELQSDFASDADLFDSPGKEGELCLNCMIDSPGFWWVGIHRVGDEHSRYPGGFFPLTLPSDAVSRAWLKFEEGIRWAEFPIGVGSRCVDIGSAPGGGSQVLLARGASVIGVDPAEMAPVLLANPNFTHCRGKINQIKRVYFRKARWLLADMNVAPHYTLDALEELVRRPDVSIRGLLFTLKLFQWELATNIPEYIHRIKSWGFNQVKVRHLQFNRQEIMVAASKTSKGTVQ